MTALQAQLGSPQVGSLMERRRGLCVGDSSAWSFAPLASCAPGMFVWVPTHHAGAVTCESSCADEAELGCGLLLCIGAAAGVWCVASRTAASFLRGCRISCLLCIWRDGAGVGYFKGLVFYRGGVEAWHLRTLLGCGWRHVRVQGCIRSLWLSSTEQSRQAVKARG